ncbi:MAG: HEAT repeat domain-containing protein [Vicinamibacterales bacterium]
MAWILRLEDQRILRAAAEPIAAPVAAPPARKRKNAAPVLAPVAVAPDLTELLKDSSAAIRRRAALAVGRVGLPEGAAPLEATLTDANADVRQMAAFALGLLADTSAVPALTTALQDPDPLVRGRAAEALGLIGDAASAPAVGQMVSAFIKAGALAAVHPDDEQWPMTPQADAVRLGLFALVRQKRWDALQSTALDPSGQPVSDWWPIAYALQRINDPRAAPALRRLLGSPGRYTRAFAARGLGGLKDQASAPLVISMLQHAGNDVALQVSAIRALAQIGGPTAAPAILSVLTADGTDPNAALEAVTALGDLKDAAALPYIQDRLTDDWPTMRAAAIRAASTIDPQGFLTVLSGLEPDRQWVVRAAVARVLASAPASLALERLHAMLNDPDKRVVAAALETLARMRAPSVPDVNELLLTSLKAPDVGVRTAAAEGIGRLKMTGGAAALAAAYANAASDPPEMRSAIVSAIHAFGPAEADATLKAALADPDWSVRLQAAALLQRDDPSSDPRRAIRPAPEPPILAYTSPDLIAPQYSPHAFIETAKGTIEIELAVLDAPQTCQSFMALARKGYFNGLQIHRVVPNFVVQDGDPRGDGSGGPGYTIRDELNGDPYVRGTVGMALSGPDTGGSQFFIAHSPQPHLDAKYTVFGHVVKGMDVVDRLQQLDVIQRVRIWDGKAMQ